jgi:hypothetical protein
MILALVYLAALASVPLAGGRLARLSELTIRRPWLALAAIAVQVLIVSLLPEGTPLLHHAAHLGSYVLLGAFAWANRRIAGVPIAAFGGALNFLAIAANGGVMPASHRALASLSHKTAAGDFANSAALAHPKLQFLGDVIATPASWPVHNVYSIGDLVIVSGVVVLLHAACGSRLRLRLRRRDRGGRAEAAAAPS